MLAGTTVSCPPDKTKPVLIDIHINALPVSGSVANNYRELTLDSTCDGRTNVSIRWGGAIASISFGVNANPCSNNGPVLVPNATGYATCTLKKIPMAATPNVPSNCTDPSGAGKPCMKYTVVTSILYPEDPKVIMDGRAAPIPGVKEEGGRERVQELEGKLKAKYCADLTSEGAKGCKWPHGREETLRVEPDYKILWKSKEAGWGVTVPQGLCRGESSDTNFDSRNPVCTIQRACGDKKSCSFDYQAKIGDKQLTGLKIVVHK
jgi:hypothetical protein